jgi:hypothetical protein
MTQIAERYEKIAGEFADRVRSVPEEAWDQPGSSGWPSPTTRTSRRS